MIGWLYRMIVGRFGWCRHDWEMLGKSAVTSPYQGTLGYRFYLRCKSCGDITYRNT